MAKKETAKKTVTVEQKAAMDTLKDNAEVVGAMFSLAKVG